MGINHSKLENKNTDSPSKILLFVNTTASLDNLKSCPDSVYKFHSVIPPSAECDLNNRNKNSVPTSILTTYISDTIQNYSEGNKEPKINNTRTVNLRIFHQNIRGLRNKIKELTIHLSSHVPHILCFTEHHLKESEINNTCINYYNLGASYCINSCKLGGVGIFVHNTLSYTSVI